MREIPKKNYVMLFVLVLGVVFITLAGATLYKNYSVKELSYMSDNITIVDSSTVENYTNVNSLVFIYVADMNDTKYQKEEKKLLKKIEELDLKKHFVFFDIDDSKNLSFLKNTYDVDYKDNALILMIEDNMLVGSVNLNEKFSETFEKFVNSYGVLDD